MTLAESMPDRAVLVAIDVVKHRNEILIEVPGRARRRRLTELSAKADHDRLVEALETVNPAIPSTIDALSHSYHGGARSVARS